METSMWVRATKLLISTSLLLSLDGALIVVFGSLLYGTQMDLELVIAAFLAVFSIYNLNKITDKVEDSINQRERAFKTNKIYSVLSVGAIIISLAIGALKGFFYLLILLTPIILGIFYSVKMSNKLPRLKEITGAKSIIVAFSWSTTGAFLPLTSGTINFMETSLVFTYIFIQVLINTVLFDSFDTKGDLVTGIKTIPSLLGQSRTKVLLLSVNSTLIFWLGLCYIEGIFKQFLLPLLFGIIYGYLIILRFLGKNLREVSTEIIIDGEWLLIVPMMKLFVPI